MPAAAAAVPTAAMSAAAMSAAAVSTAAATMSAAAAAAMRELYPQLPRSKGLLVEGVERRQAYVGDFLVKKERRIKRSRKLRRRSRNGCAA